MNIEFVINWHQEIMDAHIHHNMVVAAVFNKSKHAKALPVKLASRSKSLSKYSLTWTYNSCSRRAAAFIDTVDQRTLLNFCMHEYFGCMWLVSICIIFDTQFSIPPISEILVLVPCLTVVLCRKLYLPKYFTINN